MNLRYSVPVLLWKDSFLPTWFVSGLLCVARAVLLFWSKVDPELFRSINFLNTCSKKPYCNYTIVLHFMIDYAPLMVWLLFSGNFSGWSFLTLLNFFSYFFKNFCLISIQNSILPNLVLQINTASTMKHRLYLSDFYTGHVTLGHFPYLFWISVIFMRKGKMIPCSFACIFG